jgi:biotin transport system substrate-specific component
LIVVAAVFIAALSQASFFLPNDKTVPVTLQTFAVLLVSALYGWFAVFAVATYLIAGACGLPVFASHSGGLGHLTGATSGYLWGFLLAACVTVSCLLLPRSK